MRNIKFRVWDGEKMHVVRQLDMLESGAVEVLVWSDDGGMDEDGGLVVIGCTCVKDCKIQSRFDSAITLVQFTGLVDKNGKDIYEGDVVTWTHMGGNQVVRYDQDECVFVADTPANEPDSWLDSTCEIIGNKWENPLEAKP